MAKATLLQTERQLQEVKQFFLEDFCKQLSVEKVQAPLFLEKSTGLNDNLNGIEVPVSFKVHQQTTPCEVVQSLAKWKRVRLGQLELPNGKGIVTDMRAIRPDEEVSDLHSYFVDQWDWEKRIAVKDRTLNYLKSTVEKIYAVIYATEQFAQKKYKIKAILPKKITFLHTEELLELYPKLTPRQREDEVAKKYGAVFIIGIGGELANGTIHDGRAPDYDDWTTPTLKGKKGLNGDIVVWHPTLKRAFELSSMGIRVDKKALLEQLKIRKCTEREKLPFHQSIIKDKIPLSIGGGIGQSRVAMYILRKEAVSEVQHGVWPAKQVTIWKKKKRDILSGSL